MARACFGNTTIPHEHERLRTAYIASKKAVILCMFSSSFVACSLQLAAVAAAAVTTLVNDGLAVVHRGHDSGTQVGLSCSRQQHK
jgi:hypothetical protein